MKYQITYRKVIPKDKLLIFEWSNEKEARKNSFYSNEILLEEHSDWFDKKLKDKNTELIIAEISEKPVCLIRFDKNINYATVGINLDRDFRGKGMASIILSECCKKYFQVHGIEIHAFIKKENIASIRSFEKAGFVLLNETFINQCEAFELKYLNHGK